MSTTDKIARDFRRTVCSEIELIPEGSDRYVVSTPFTFNDGDEFTILLRKEGHGWTLADEAHTFMHLSYEMKERDWKKGRRAKIIEQVLSMFEVTNEDGELRRRVDNDAFGDALFDYVQALSKITDISFLKREVVHSTFLDDFREFVRERVPAERRTFNWTDAEHDPDGTYPVDVRVAGPRRPLFFFALNTNTRVRDATISLLKYEQWGLEYDSAGVFEDVGDISDRQLTKFMDVAGTLFSNLKGNRDRLGGFLEQHLN